LFVLKTNFEFFFAEIHHKKMLKILVAVWHRPTYFLYVITNHETDAIKVVVHLLDMKFRKLEKNGAETLTNKS